MSATRPPSYDDRFVVPLEPSRRGAHRARMSPVIAALPIVAVVAVVVAVIGLAWTLFGGNLLGGNGAATNAASVSAPASNPAASTAPTQSAAPSATASQSATPTVTKTTAAVDKAIKVVVFNTTNRAGLAQRTAETLKAGGWTKATFSRKVPNAGQTVVYYATTDQKASAEEIVTELQAGTVKKSATLVAGGIAVVLGTDLP